MLLVDDQQAKILECDVRREQPVGPDHDIDIAARDALHQRSRLLRAAKARQHFDAHRVIGEPLAKCAPVLLGENRRGHRSEEHTSELQSLAYLVCRLLLEKKKNTSLKYAAGTRYRT